MDVFASPAALKSSRPAGISLYRQYTLPVNTARLLELTSSLTSTSSSAHSANMKYSLKYNEIAYMRTLVLNPYNSLKIDSYAVFIN